MYVEWSGTLKYANKVFHFYWFLWYRPLKWAKSVSLFRPLSWLFRLRAVHGLFSALENCTDIVQITDNRHQVSCQGGGRRYWSSLFQIVWCNHTAEKVLGYGRDEMIGKDIRELQTTGSGDSIKQGETEMDDWILNKLQSGKTWEGPINCSRKTGDFVALNSRVIPVSNNSNRSLTLSEKSIIR